MRSFSSFHKVLGLIALSFFAVPVSLTVVGCSKATATIYCNGLENGPVVGQVATITLSPSLATVGESLNYGQIGQSLSASAQDCKGGSVAVRSFTFASTDSSMTYADINPSTGSVCGGTWNRQTGGGIPDYTICNAPTSTPSQFLAYVTATADGATSNAVPVYVHPVVTGVVLGPATPSGSCPSASSPKGNDPGTDCFPINTTGTVINAPVYSSTGCLSQGITGQLVSRVYANGKVDAADNITGQVGHIGYTSQTSSNVVSIDQNGVATANQPGSSIITANVANSGTSSSAGFFSTCPPTSITLSVPTNPTATSVNVTVNNLQPLTATVKDKNGVTLTGLNLEYNSTDPRTVPASVGSVTPIFPGTATITAVCLPGTCNISPFSQIGYLGNGEPLTSNGITINATGTSSTVLYMASTSSQYIQPVDFTTGQTSSLIKLPYAPNSMVISQDGSALYLGSPQGLITVSTASNAAGNANQAIPGTVLAVSPDGSTIVVTDPVRQTISLIGATSGNASSTYGGVGVRAAWTPDSQTVYVITTTGTVLSHSSFANWQTTQASEVYSDLAVTVPNVGAYFAGPSFYDGRSYCTVSSVGAGTPPNVTNSFAPLADENATVLDRIAATTDGKHMLGAHVTTGSPATFTDIVLTLPPNTAGSTPYCPVPNTAQAPIATGYFQSSPTTQPITGITPSAINGVVASTNSAVAFVTYQIAGTTGGGVLPAYNPATGALTYLTLANGATVASAPVSGVFSQDNSLFFAGTSGDNQVHKFGITGSTATETGVLTPNLPFYNGTGIAPVNLLAQKPRKTTN